MAKVKVRVTTGAQLNFGTGKRPNHKTYGDVVEIEQAQADRLIAENLVELVKEDKANGN